MQAGYVPVNNSESSSAQGRDPESHSLQLQQQHDEHDPSSGTTTHYISSSDTKIGPNGQAIYSAVAVPDTIRPPKVSKSQIKEDPISIRSFSKRICILLIGLILSLMTFWECIELFFARKVFLGFCFLGATVGLLIGTFVGVFRGQWRILVPGLILQHIVFTTLSFFPYKES